MTILVAYWSNSSRIPVSRGTIACSKTNLLTSKTNRLHHGFILGESNAFGAETRGQHSSKSKAEIPAFSNFADSILAMSLISRPSSWYSCCPSCGRCKGVESPKQHPSTTDPAASASTSRRSSIASTSSRSSLPNAYAMVATSFAESKSSAVRDWDEGRCKRQYNSKSLRRTSVVAAFFNEELVREMASSRTRPRVA